MTIKITGELSVKDKSITLVFTGYTPSIVTKLYVALPSSIKDLNERSIQRSINKETSQLICVIKLPGKDLPLEIYGIRLALAASMEPLKAFYTEIKIVDTHKEGGTL